jgi:hypothetical protein
VIKEEIKEPETESPLKSDKIIEKKITKGS